MKHHQAVIAELSDTQTLRQNIRIIRPNGIFGLVYEGYINGELSATWLISEKAPHPFNEIQE
jgi:hypothetical protein